MTGDTTDLIDTEDYHRRQRLKEIHQARQRVHEATEELRHLASQKDHTNARYNLGVAVSAYYSEIEPLLDVAGQSIDLPDPLPWDTAKDYADRIGMGEDKPAQQTHSLVVFREINQFLAEVRPLIDESDQEATGDYSDLL